MGKKEIDSSPRLLSSLNPWFILLVVLGVAGLLAIHYIESAERKQLEASQNARAEDLKLQVAQANERATKAQLELEKIRAPRIITPEQRKEIKAAMSGYAPQLFRVESAVNDPEAGHFAMLIRDVLTQCGWKGAQWVMPVRNIGPGVTIATGKEDMNTVRAGKTPPRSIAIASKLYQTMKESGIVMTEGPMHDTPNEPIPAGTIVIDVGPRP